MPSTLWMCGHHAILVFTFYSAFLIPDTAFLREWKASWQPHTFHRSGYEPLLEWDGGMKGWHPPATKVFTVRLDICGETCKGLSSKKASAREARKNSRLRRGRKVQEYNFQGNKSSPACRSDLGVVGKYSQGLPNSACSWDGQMGETLARPGLKDSAILFGRIDIFAISVFPCKRIAYVSVHLDCL